MPLFAIIEQCCPSLDHPIAKEEVLSCSTDTPSVCFGKCLHGVRLIKDRDRPMFEVPVFDIEPSSMLLSSIADSHSRAQVDMSPLSYLSSFGLSCKVQLFSQEKSQVGFAPI